MKRSVMCSGLFSNLPTRHLDVAVRQIWSLIMHGLMKIKLHNPATMKVVESIEYRSFYSFYSSSSLP